MSGKVSQNSRKSVISGLPGGNKCEIHAQEEPCEEQYYEKHCAEEIDFNFGFFPWESVT